MDQFLLSILMLMSRLEGVQDVPAEPSAIWQTANQWVEDETGIHYTASSSELIQQCKNNPQGFVRFPTVLYGAQEIFLDDAKRILFGDPTMKTPNFVSSAPVLECHSILNIHAIKWRVTAYSRYFARVQFLPYFVAEKPLTKLFGETLYIGGAIGLLVLAIFSISILYGKESHQLSLSLFFSILGLALYNIGQIAPAFEIKLSMLMVHRISDIACVFGALAIVYCFRLENLVPAPLFKAHMASAFLSLPFLLFGGTGDSIQFGTTLPFTTLLISFAFATWPLMKNAIRDKTFEASSKLLYSVIFFLVVINDVFIFTGSSAGYTLISVGILLAFLVLLLSVNQRLSATYRERDYLRGNLELEVKRKTAELQNKTQELESAMSDLRHTQAELIQSAKLASLGTLSAGIAHEINNSINFVSGAVTPLERLVAKLEPVSKRDYDLATRLLLSIKDGINITVEIVKSLRQFTGLNQAKLKDLHLSEVISSVTTILKSKLKENYRVVPHVPADLTIYGDVVGINQILMNLMTNAMDAMPEGGTIEISARQSPEGDTIVEFKDQGSGIDEAHLSRIFDPFFTTKDVGSGTGLGLYIIQREMEKHEGQIQVQSKLGAGTKFTLTFPKKTARSERSVA